MNCVRCVQIFVNIYFNISKPRSGCNKIIKIDPENVAALYNKAVMFNSMGNIQDAVKLLEKLVRKSPTFVQGKSKLEEYRSMLKGAA